MGPIRADADMVSGCLLSAHLLSVFFQRFSGSGGRVSRCRALSLYWPLMGALIRLFGLWRLANTFGIGGRWLSGSRRSLHDVAGS